MFRNKCEQIYVYLQAEFFRLIRYPVIVNPLIQLWFYSMAEGQPPTSDQNIRCQHVTVSL